MSKLASEIRAAGQAVRARIHQLIADNPGISSAAIAELLDMPTMALAGHLSMLSREGIIMVEVVAATTKHKPRVTRLYPVSSPAPPPPAPPRPLNKGGAGRVTPMPDDPEHRAWMRQWNPKNSRCRRADVMAMRGRV